MTKNHNLEYTGIAKNGPFSLIAAFSATFGQKSRLVLGLEESGLKEDALDDPASITACYTAHFNLSAETVSRAAQALQQTEPDMRDGKIAMDAISQGDGFAITYQRRRSMIYSYTLVSVY